MPFVKRKLPASAPVENQLPGESDLAWVVRRNLRARRQEAGLTQAQLSRAMKISKVHLTHLETGRNISENKLVESNLGVIQRAAKVLGCTPVDLVTPYRFFSP